MSDQTPAIVNIIDVMPDAVQIRACELRQSDQVFDAAGNTHALKSVRILKGGIVSFLRDDMDHREYWEGDLMVTVQRRQG